LKKNHRKKSQAVSKAADKVYTENSERYDKPWGRKDMAPTAI
jgi:hypothetical protein